MQKPPVHPPDHTDDAVVFILLLVFVVMLAAALLGSPTVFAYGTVGALAGFMGIALVRRRDSVTWVPPIAATLVLLGAVTGIFVYQDSPVRSPADTVGGFQTATAFVVYGIWIPAFFTVGVGFAAVFDRLYREPDSSERGQ